MNRFDLRFCRPGLNANIFDCSISVGWEGHTYLRFEDGVEAERYCGMLGIEPTLWCNNGFENSIKIADSGQHNAHVWAAEMAGFSVEFDSCHKPVLVEHGFVYAA